MLRFVRHAISILLALVTLTIGAVSVYVWHLGDKAYNAAEAEGLFAPAPSNAPMTTFEASIQKTWFSRNWNERSPVCSQIAGAWTAFTGGRPEPNEIAVVLSNQIFLSLPDHDLTLESHLRRASLACALEGRLSNLQMMRIYLRRARFDGKSGGAERASQTVFGKPAGELDAEQAILLAALFESPKIRDRPDEWKRRADHVRERLLNAAGGSEAIDRN